jgi:DNA excision repair protein ERCC-1
MSSLAANSGKNNILVNLKQKGNPLLRHIRLIPWQFCDDVIPDYVMSSICVIFLSMKYHLLHPRYAERRISEVGHTFKLRVLLVYVDDLGNTQLLLDLNKLCFVSDFTLFIAWSNEECGRYLETFRYYEDKPANAIQV